MSTRAQRIDDYVKTNRKSIPGALVLAILFGPVGQLYASTLGGSIAILISLGFAVTAPALILLVWLICVLTAPLAASEYNKRLRTKAELLAQ